MAGTRSDTLNVLGAVTGYSNAAVTLNQYLTETLIPFDCRIGAVAVYADGAGVGAGNTTVDVLLNGTSIFNVSGDKPVLASASTGEFTNNPPAFRGVTGGKPDTPKVLAIQVIGIPATSGHSRVKATVVLEQP